MASERIARLIELLDVELLEGEELGDDGAATGQRADVYRGDNGRESRGRVFGGQVAGQALMAAGRTVDGRLPHSLHAYFLRPGRPSIPIHYSVERIRDGGSFTTRRVVATQHGEAIFNMAAQFHALEPGPAHQIEMPDVPGPEQVPSWEEIVQRRIDAGARVPPWARKRAVEMRLVDEDPKADGAARGSVQRFWVKADPMPDDALLHLCVATYTSDHSLLGAIRRPHGGGMGIHGDFMSASLDHALWFHRHFRMDQWLLYDQISPVSAHARGLAMGHFYTQDGELVASVCQEGLLRPIDPEKRRGSRAG